MTQMRVQGARGRRVQRAVTDSLFELGDPYFEADEVLGEFAGRAYLNQFFYTRSVDPS